MILAGRGALGSGELLERAAEQLGAPIVKALLGKAAVPDDSPYTTGGIGLLGGTRPSQEAIESCDTLLLAGTSFPYMEFLHTGELQRIENRGERPSADGKLDQSRMQRMAERLAMKEVLRLAPGSTRRREERSNRFLQRRGESIEGFLIPKGPYDLFGRHE